VSGTAVAVQTEVNSKKMPRMVDPGITHGIWYRRFKDYLRVGKTDGILISRIPSWRHVAC
jgi:hypothetical protein